MNMKLIINPFRVFRVVRGSLLTFPKTAIQPRKARKIEQELSEGSEKKKRDPAMQGPADIEIN